MPCRSPGPGRSCSQLMGPFPLYPSLRPPHYLKSRIKQSYIIVCLLHSLGQWFPELRSAAAAVCEDLLEKLIFQPDPRPPRSGPLGVRPTIWASISHQVVLVQLNLENHHFGEKKPLCKCVSRKSGKHSVIFFRPSVEGHKPPDGLAHSWTPLDMTATSRTT